MALVAVIVSNEMNDEQYVALSNNEPSWYANGNQPSNDGKPMPRVCCHRHYVYVNISNR